MTTNDGGSNKAAADAKAQVLSLVPKNVTRDQFAVAALVGAGAVGLWGLRRGMRGIGPIELTGFNLYSVQQKVDLPLNSLAGHYGGILIPSR